MDNEWHDISDIDDFKEYYEFNDYVVDIVDEDEDGETTEYRDISFGIALMPKGTKRFFCVPSDESA